MAGRISYYGNIVTQGLVLDLDVAKKDSYPGSGTTFRDISSNNITGSFIGSPTFSSNFYGGIVFNGTAQQGTTENKVSISGLVTVCACVRHNTIPNSRQRYLTLTGEHACIRHDGVPNAGNFHFFIFTDGTSKSLNVTNQIAINTNYYFCGTWDGTTMRAYKNGVEIGTPVVPGGTMATVTTTAEITSTGEPLNGTIFNAQVYNRALSSSEVLQNYNALKGRYGI